MSISCRILKTVREMIVSLLMLVMIGTFATLISILNASELERSENPNVESIKKTIIISEPISNWRDNYMYHARLMELIVSNESIRTVGITKLTESGFGNGGIEYIYDNGDGTYLLNEMIIVGNERLINVVRNRKADNRYVYIDKSIFPIELPKYLTEISEHLNLQDFRK